MARQEIETLIKYLFDRWVDEKEPIKKVRYSGIDFGREEYRAMLDAIFSDWWSGGKYTLRTERTLAKQAERNHALLFNSGSSANLALMAAARQLYFKEGDPILTFACGFPTTVNPIIQAGLTPVFADVNPFDLSITPEKFEEYAKTIKGVFIPHTLGFCGDINAILDIARKHNIMVFYDACDAYGSAYEGKPVTHYGKAATYSFYAAHHISCGEGGAVVTNDEELHTVMRGMRNWGRYCSSGECCVRAEDPEAFCPPAKYTKDNDLPSDYTVNYQFEWIGYNLKMLDLQAAILGVQLGRMEEYNNIRIRNYERLFSAFEKAPVVIWGLQEGVSPFSFPLVIVEDARFTRKHFMDFLMRNGIESRLIFGGNLTRHPAYKSIGQTQTLEYSDVLMKRGMMLGVSHVITPDKMEYVCSKIKEFLS